MAYPTAVNDQITDSVTQSHAAGGDDALNSISELLEAIAHSLNAVHSGTSSSQSKFSIADNLSSAFAKAESDLLEILIKAE